jgi:hypothetical protein
MHTEHLQNVSIMTVLASWLVAVAVASLVALALLGTGILHDDMSPTSMWWSVFAIAVGFFAGGMFAGFRALQAPVLHALGVGITSLVMWFLLNAVVAVFLSASPEWPGMSTEYTVGVLLLQFVAAMFGALMGYNIALRGKPGLSEHEPV